MTEKSYKNIDGLFVETLGEKSFNSMINSNNSVGGVLNAEASTPYKCDECTFFSISKYHLITHMKSTHVDLKTSKYPHCLQSANNSVDIERHADSIHGKSSSLSLAGNGKSETILTKYDSSSFEYEFNKKSEDLCSGPTTKSCGIIIDSSEDKTLATGFISHVNLQPSNSSEQNLRRLSSIKECNDPEQDHKYTYLSSVENYSLMDRSTSKNETDQSRETDLVLDFKVEPDL